MCRAFSCLCGRDKLVVWKFGTDSHDILLELTEWKDNTRDPQKIEFCRIEISPKNENYLEPDQWIFKIDMDITPTWWTLDHKKACLKEHKKWLKQLNAIIVRKAIVHPFRDRTPPKITPEIIDLVRQWASVWDSVRDSVWASVGAYSGSFFILPRSTWKHTERIECGDAYPFQPAVDLWEIGLIPSYGGKVWRLHGGPEGKVLWEGNL